MTTLVVVFALPAASLVATRCRTPVGDCASVGVPAVRATITDSITGAPLAYRASLIIRDGHYVDSVPASILAVDSASLRFIDASIDRAGTYSVTVRRDGSRVWTRDDVGARRDDGCTLKGAELNVRLQRAGGT